MQGPFAVHSGQHLARTSYPCDRGRQPFCFAGVVDEKRIMWERKSKTLQDGCCYPRNLYTPRFLSVSLRRPKHFKSRRGASNPPLKSRRISFYQSSSFGCPFTLPLDSSGHETSADKLGTKSKIMTKTAALVVAQHTRKLTNPGKPPS